MRRPASSQTESSLNGLEQQPELAGVVARGGRPKGTGRHLTAKQEARALRWICGGCPDQLQLPFALWTRRAVQELFRVRFAVRMPIRTVGLYLERWGMTPQRPTRRAYERDDAAVRRWLRAEYPKIARQARAEGAEICWGDETGLRSDESRHRGYAPRGRAERDLGEREGERDGQDEQDEQEGEAVAPRGGSRLSTAGRGR